MYESIFGLKKRPFVAAPLVDRYFPATSIEHARQTLARVIERAAGPGVLAGSAGTGKTLLCQLLAAQFRDEYQVVTLATARLRSPRALLQNILFELRLPYRDREEGELRLALIDHLQRSDACPNGMLLLVDEAHTMPLPLLEEIRMITNLVRADQPRVRLVIAGGPTLEERFASPRLESLNQRIAARCYLESMNRSETMQYVCSQITAVGGEPEKLFSDDALHAIHIASDGIPRLVNQVCDHALVLAAAGGKTVLDAAGIEEAWADLQQLPAPSLATPAAETGADGSDASVVEFGQLDDEPAVTSQTIPFEEPLGVPVDPGQQLDRIEAGISEANDEPQGAGPSEQSTDDQFSASVMPADQIELVLEIAPNPFAEAFEEEEIVVDKYAVLDGGPNAEVNEPKRGEPETNHPESAESEDSGVDKTLVFAESDLSQLETVEAAHMSEPIAEEAIARPDDEPSAEAEVTPELPSQTLQWTPDFSPDDESSVTQPVVDVYQHDIDSHRGEDEQAVAAAIVQEESHVVPADHFDDDRDMIVVDNQIEEVPKPRGPQIGRARRQEYRRLFANLRQG